MADEDDITFTILDEATVERLQKRGDIRLPARKINPDKDIPWNMKQLNSKLLQGIIAGDPIPQIRNLFSEVIGNNATSTMRAARTMTTSAENRGRLDSYENLEAQGVVQKKVWIATPDDRTREAHLELDGQEVDIDEPFVDMDGNDLMYPGDPDAAPETVWNCRCSMRTHIVGFKRDDGSVSKVDYGRDTTTHAAQIEEEREDRVEKNSARIENEEEDSLDNNAIELVTRWGRNGNGGFSDSEANDFLNLAGIQELDGDISADIRKQSHDVRIKLSDDNKEVVLLVSSEKNSVYIDYISVSQTGTGAGTKMLEEIKKNASDQGFSTLTAYAAGDFANAQEGGYNGYYSLARFGFDGKIPDSLSDDAKKLFGAESIQDLMKTEEGRSWWKKNGTGFEATLDLTKKRR